MSQKFQFLRAACRWRKWIALATGLCLAGVATAAVVPQLLMFFDRTGVMGTYNVDGRTSTNNPFFQSLGTNGRSCATCHVASDAFGLSAAHAQRVFRATSARDPLFADVDGANCPGVSRSDPASHSMILNNGLFRISLQVPVDAEFKIQAVHDPYGCAITTDAVTGQQTVSVYRRPLPSTNLSYLSAVMIDGRETVAPLNNPATFAANLATDLAHQALDATLGHAQAAVPPTSDQIAAIVEYESSLYSAQVVDNRAGMLDAGNAQGGPLQLSKQIYYPGINDTLGQDPQGHPFNPEVFTTFVSWANGGAGRDGLGDPEARAAIAAGEAIFNSHPLTISNVRGLNDNPAVAAALGTSLPVPAFQGTCSTCHDTPNIGDHSAPVPLDIGTSHDPAQEQDSSIANGLSQLTSADMPVYEITGCPNPFPVPEDSGAPYVVYTTDPGRALITGHCNDLNRIKGPVLHGLAARAPYFHNGAAKNLMEVVNFYNQRFQMNLTNEEKSDLVAFLNSL
jgi:cytochrome c peroxidase